MSTPFDSADEDLLAEIVSQAEKRLQAQLDLAKAADQRAMTFSGLLFAGLAVLFRLAFEQTTSKVGVEPVCVIFGFLLAATFSLASAWPSSWNSLGNEPKNYTKDIAEKTELKLVRAETAIHLQSMIEENEIVIRRNAWLMRASMTLALITGFVGLIAQAL